MLSPKALFTSRVMVDTLALLALRWFTGAKIKSVVVSSSAAQQLCADINVSFALPVPYLSMERLFIFTQSEIIV